MLPAAAATLAGASCFDAIASSPSLLHVSMALPHPPPRCGEYIILWAAGVLFYLLFPGDYKGDESGERLLYLEFGAEVISYHDKSILHSDVALSPYSATTEYLVPSLITPLHQSGKFPCIFAYPAMLVPGITLSAL